MFIETAPVKVPGFCSRAVVVVCFVALAASNGCDSSATGDAATGPDADSGVGSPDCGSPADGSCPEGCDALGGYPVNQEEACFEEPEIFVCMPPQEIALGIDACYESASGDRWWTVFYPYFSQTGWGWCNEDYFNTEPCE